VGLLELGVVWIVPEVGVFIALPLPQRDAGRRNGPLVGCMSTSCFDRIPNTFNELNALHALRPIEDDVALDNAIEQLDKLAVMNERTKDQADYLETLTTLVEKYEAEHDPIQTDDLSVVDILTILMDGREMSASDLGGVLGSRELAQCDPSGGAAAQQGAHPEARRTLQRQSSAFPPRVIKVPRTRIAHVAARAHGSP
jgi:antitoxin component HigA of HigAB toxin-antitoxin module